MDLKVKVTEKFSDEGILMDDLLSTSCRMFIMMMKFLIMQVFSHQGYGLYIQCFKWRVDWSVAKVKDKKFLKPISRPTEIQTVTITS